MGVWKAIISRWVGFKTKVVIRLGNGLRVKFWMDGWHGEEPLGVTFPTSFSIVTIKDAWSVKMSDWNEGRGWNLDSQERSMIGK